MHGGGGVILGIKCVCVGVCIERDRKKRTSDRECFENSHLTIDVHYLR